MPRMYTVRGTSHACNPKAATVANALKGSTMNKKSRLTPVRFAVRAGLTATPSPFSSTSWAAASEPGTNNFTRANDEARRNEELVRAYAAALDAAWEGQPLPVPATDRKPMHTLEGTGIELTEALYAGIVQVLFEDAGVEDAFGQVVCNRALISGYRDAGADPSELTLQVLSRR